MKFKANFYSQEVKEDIDHAYAQILHDLPGVLLSYVIRENCLTNKRGIDLLIELTITDPNDLGKYLTHPAHLAISEKYNPCLTERGSFDYED